MQRLAVVIGSACGLNGTRNDVETMSELLGERGFEVRPCVGDRATRAAILEELERLISRTGPGDAVVVTYSGHGGNLGPIDGPDLMDPDLQFLVPEDFFASAPEDPRVVTSLELSVAMARLTERTDNCTVVLDCCHSGQMARDPRLRTKALRHPTYLDIAGHNNRMRRSGLRTDLLDPVSNRRAVRVVACQRHEVAYEYTDRNGRTRGLLTEAVQVALTEADGQPVPWQALADRIRGRVRAVAPTQRPEVEGPSRRLVFDTAEVEVATTLSVTRLAPNGVSLPGARLTGIRAGDTLAVLPAGVTDLPARSGDTGEAGQTVVAVATVDRMSGTGAEATLAFRSGYSSVPSGARALLLSTAARRWPVAVTGDSAVADELRAAVREAPTLRVATHDATDDDADDIAEVVVGEQLALRDAAGPLAEPADTDAAGVRRVVANATLLARAAAVRAVEPETGQLLTDPVTVEWGRVAAGDAQPLPTTGAVLHKGDHVYLRLRNDGDRNCFFHVLACGIDGAVTSVLAHSPGGLRLEPGEQYVVGQRDAEELVGVEVSWPDGIPAGTPRPESIVVLVVSALEDLSALTQVGVRDPWIARAAVRAVEQLRSGGSPLQRLIAQAMIGGTRTVAAEQSRGGSVRYAVHAIDYLLSPVPRPAEETARFHVDERPQPSVRLLTRPGAPREVAVRFAELRVEGDRAPLGDVRVDGLVVVTASGTPAFQAKTLRFKDVRPGARLPLDGTTIYRGPSGDWLDLAWWICDDRTSAPDLHQLLVDALARHDFTASAALAVALAPAQPDAALAVAACDATAVVVNAAHGCLSTVADSIAGLCRTSWHPGENFGAGRHPAAGSLRTYDVSFAYSIDAED